MNQKGISNKAVIITIIVVILILIGLYFITQSKGQGDVGSDGDDGEELNTDLGNALTDTGDIDSELDLDDDFDFGIE